MRSTPRCLSTPLSFWVSAGIVAHTLWTSAAPAMVYPLYAHEWNLTPTVTTAIFAVYPIVVVAMLVLFGDLSDFIGRRSTMLLGLGSSIIGVFLFAIAPNVATLFIGRVFMGIGVGLSAGPSTAALQEFAGSGGVTRASSTTIVAQAIGFSCALIVGGFLVQYAPFPSRLTFIVLFVLLLALFAVSWFLPENRRANVGRWHPKIPGVRREIRTAFIASSVAVMTAYTHGVIITSLGAQIAKELVQSSNIFVNGSVLALFAISLGIAGLFARRLTGIKAVVWGSLASIVGMLFLAAAIAQHTLVFFIPATSISGMGYALMVYGGLAIINPVTPEKVRGGVMSALYLFAYLFTGLLAVALGKVATEVSMAVAALIGAAVMIGLCAIVIALVVSLSRTPAVQIKSINSQRA
ncbi:Predicted arabinose efflux permease, MFS family [Rhizobium sp. NFR07]|uniref:MFS transporter n=1 Tax=Rhizobium sp. NFR07 TaxID=1566262 RepID=UPI0008E7653F|nr:MFS transporter [Rhizobium sp. NFR07]SFB60506.1 Predicted arabinose efflux permease, MFS family [Rhizobium sp. NFR07]